MSKYTNIIRNAYETLKKSGITANLVRPVLEFTPVTGETNENGQLTLLLTGILKSPKTFRGNDGYDETLEEATRLGRAKVFYCAAYQLSFAPTPTDLVFINEIKYMVHAVTILQPGGEPITYSLTLIQS